jgi:hypothetical protein
MTQIFLYIGTTSFPDPGDWNPADNRVECLGVGGSGSVSYNAPFVAVAAQAEPTPLIGTSSGGGGGSGGYGFGVNLAPAFPVPIEFFATGTAWHDPVVRIVGFCGTTPTMGSGGVGGSFSPAGYSGANGGPGGGGIGGGGAGAAGPNGAGGGGTAGIGGSADGGTVPGGATSGASGISGTQWDALHGCGSGGASGGPPGAGGNYGGGGGGADGGASGFGADSAGLIVITYTPLVAGPALQVGIIRGASRAIFGVIKPVDNSELDDPAWVNFGMVQPMRELPLTLVRITRAEYDACQTMADLIALVDAIP